MSILTMGPVARDARYGASRVREIARRRGAIRLAHAAWAMCAALAIATSGCTERTSEGVVALDTTRIVVLGGAITETVFALGAGTRVVGVDASSSYPAEVQSLPQTGYHRRLSAEGVLSLDPTLVILGADAGPDTAIAQLRQAGVRVEIVPEADDLDAARDRIRRLAAILGEEARGAELIETIDTRVQEASRTTQGARDAPRVLFVYARGTANLMVGGRDTSADAMLTLAGGTNALADVDGFVSMTAEAVVTADPDVIVIPSHGLDSIGGMDGLGAIPGVAQTRAWRERRIVTMDDLMLLGFGPRTGDAVVALTHALYPPTTPQVAP